MLVKNENEWCWCLGEHVGYPQKSIEMCIRDRVKVAHFFQCGLSELMKGVTK